jgi:hypothetical protein
VLPGPDSTGSTPDLHLICFLHVGALEAENTTLRVKPNGQDVNQV